MKRIFYLIPILFISISLYSCRKDNHSQSQDQGALLVLRTDSNFANGTVFGIDTTFFTYDANGRLKATWANYFFTPGQSEADSFFYERDEKGRTTTFTKKERRTQDSILQPLYTYVAEVFYQPGSDRIQYLLYHGFGENLDYVDSVAYDYSNGSLTGTRVFTSGDPNKPYYSNSFTIDGAGNLVASTSFIGLSYLQSDFAATYDGKINPLKRGMEEVGSPGLTSSGNVITRTTHSPSGDFEFSARFTYREDGRPLTCVYPTDPSIVYTHTNFYYH